MPEAKQYPACVCCGAAIVLMCQDHFCGQLCELFRCEHPGREKAKTFMLNRLMTERAGRNHP